MRLSSARSGPIANGISDHDRHEEQHADQRAAADAQGDLDVAHEQGRERVHAGALQFQFARIVETERQMRGGDDNAAAREMRAHQLEQHRLCRGIERRGRLVEQPERPLHRDQARDREPSSLTGGEIGRRQLGQRFEPDRGERVRRLSRRRRARRSRTQDFPQPSARISARRCGRDNAPVRRGCVRHRRLQATACRPRSAAILRSCAAATTCRRRCGRSPAALRRMRRKNRGPEKPRGRPAGRSGPVPKGSAYQPLTERRCRQPLRIVIVWMPLVHMADRRKRFYRSQLRPLLAKTLSPTLRDAGAPEKQRLYNALGSFASAGTKRKLNS